MGSNPEGKEARKTQSLREKEGVSEGKMNGIKP